MRRFFSKVGRFFWSWGFLKFLLWTITIIILLSVEEDWRGARIWAATKAKWEAKGVSFDRKAYVPPEVPDAQNLAALPLFEQEPINNGDVTYLEPVKLEQALRSNLPGNQLPSTGGSGMNGELPDIEAIRSKIASAYTEAFKDSPPLQGALAQIDALYPFVGELREAAKTRPYFRLNEDYLSAMPAGRPLGAITNQIHVSKVLALHAVLALDAHQSDVALSDITLNMQITSGILKDPSLVGGLVGIGMVAIISPPISYGMAIHAWNDAQLAQIQDELGRIDFLRSFQFAMHSEVVAESVPNFDAIKISRLEARKNFYGTGHLIDFLVLRDGWIDQNKSRSANVLFNAAETFDPQTHRVRVEAIDDLLAQTEAMQQSWWKFTPWNLLSAISAAPIINAAEKFAEAQVYYIDEARIACALERYHLAHGVYPESLDALVPACIPELPHDIINGEPYHYRLRPDGTYVLYSVGWNQKDDGGAVVYKSKDNPHVLDYHHGDWVWPMPKL
jgi:hypothetical protein